MPACNQQHKQGPGVHLRDSRGVQGQEITNPPAGADNYSACEPVYIEMPGWQESTYGLQSYDDLPSTAKAYLEKIKALSGVPIDIVSTGPDRAETIVLNHPFSL